MGTGTEYETSGFDQDLTSQSLSLVYIAMLILSLIYGTSCWSCWIFHVCLTLLPFLQQLCDGDTCPLIHHLQDFFFFSFNSSVQLSQTTPPPIPSETYTQISHDGVCHFIDHSYLVSLFPI